MVSMTEKQRTLLQKLGPGLLYAGAAVGVSHLVQSTSAGAKFGFQLLIAVILSNLIKYPFFQFGPRYAAATGKSILQGYRAMGVVPVGVFILLTLGTMLIIQAAVTVVTAGLLEYIIGINGVPVWGWATVVLGICLGILAVGKYSLLDNLMKIIVILLSVTTVIAVVLAFFGSHEKSPEFMPTFDLSIAAHKKELVGLVGWMPAPIDIAIWHSVWIIAKQRNSGRRVSLRETMLDFKVGYWGTMVLAILFVLLGALVAFGVDTKLHDPTLPAGEFAKELISLYTGALGGWARPIIAAAAFTTMFSTTLTCLDAFPRVLTESFTLLTPKKETEKERGLSYWVIIFAVAIGAVLILGTLIGNLKAMVVLATAVSFVTAPVLALLNFLVVTGKSMPKEHRPKPWLKMFSIVGLVLLSAFSLYYLWFLYTIS